jgi:hypothetical protein
MALVFVATAFWAWAFWGLLAMAVQTVGKLALSAAKFDISHALRSAASAITAIRSIRSTA